MDTNNEPTLSFIAEWFDSDPQVTKKYLLKYYTNTQEVEMKDIATRRKFLKRTKVDNELVSKDDFHIGSTIILFSRDLKLVDYGDNDTRALLGASAEKSVVVITPHASTQIGKIVKSIEDDGLTLADMKSFQIENDVISELAIVLSIDPDDLKCQQQGKVTVNHDDEDGTDNEMNFCIAIEFRGKNCIERLLVALCNVQTQLQQELNHSSTSRKLFVASTNSDETNVYRDLFLKHKHTPTTKYNQGTSKTTATSTCCVIKPHAIKGRQAGVIMDDILSRKYKISAIQVFHLDRTNAAEFYEIYKTAVKEYNAMVDELCSGPVIALEVRSDVKEFRNDVAGPWDVDMAKNIYPDTIRAKFGKDRVQNAIHCTDLPDENVNELSYFFDILCNIEE